MSDETDYLADSPVNAERLRQAIERLEGAATDDWRLVWVWPPHDHPSFVEDCFRCDLSRDES